MNQPIAFGCLFGVSLPIFHKQVFISRALGCQGSSPRDCDIEHFKRFTRGVETLQALLATNSNGKYSCVFASLNKKKA